MPTDGIEVPSQVTAAQEDRLGMPTGLPKANKGSKMRELEKRWQWKQSQHGTELLALTMEVGTKACEQPASGREKKQKRGPDSMWEPDRLLRGQ